MYLGIENSFLKSYFEYTENTESAKIYHLWCAISSIGATMSTNIHLPFGPFKIYPNQYIILIGPPGAKKTSAITIAKKLVRKYSSIGFAPDDTGGQRQGLISAIAELSEKLNGSDELKEFFSDMNSAQASQTSKNGNTGNKEKTAPTLYAIAEELRSLLSATSEDTLTFLIRMFDCDNYTYKLKDSQITIENQLLSILAATTVDQLNIILPFAAIGQGFSSRLILAYAYLPHKEIPWPEPLDDKLEKKLGEVYSYVAQMRGAFIAPQEVKDYVGTIYKEKPIISDSRFQNYNQRRQTHLLKTAMVLCAMDKRIELKVMDFEEANRILKVTEGFMPDAIGEYGLEPLDRSKQRIIDFIRASGTEDIDYGSLRSSMCSEMPVWHFRKAMDELITTNRITVTETAADGKFVGRGIVSLVLTNTQKVAQNVIAGLSLDEKKKLNT